MWRRRLGCYLRALVFFFRKSQTRCPTFAHGALSNDERMHRWLSPKAPPVYYLPRSWIFIFPLPSAFEFCFAAVFHLGGVVLEYGRQVSKVHSGDFNPLHFPCLNFVVFFACSLALLPGYCSPWGRLRALYARCRWTGRSSPRSRRYARDPTARSEIKKTKNKYKDEKLFVLGIFARACARLRFVRAKFKFNTHVQKPPAASNGGMPSAYLFCAHG